MCTDLNQFALRVRCVSGIFFLSLLLTGGCQERGRPSRTESAVLRRALGGEPATLDPAIAADTFSYEVLRDLYEGLTAESPDGDVIPGVASTWNVDSTGMQYTFQLRPDARWSNGQPVLARDFISAWQRLLVPGRGSPVADDLRIILHAGEVIAGRMPATALGVSALGERELQVRLEQPAPYFLQLLTHPAAFPVFSDESVRSHTAAKWVSNGAYVLSSWSPGSTITLKRSESYWDKANAHIPTVEYQFISDEQAQVARYRAGQLDMTDTIPTSALQDLQKQKPQEFVIAPFLATAYYGFNLSRPPFASSVKLRKAVAMAIDRKKLVHALAFGQKAAFGFIPPGITNYTPQHWEWENLSDDERITEAKRLYAEAGYSRQSPLHLALLYNSNPGIRDTAVMIASMLKQVLDVDTSLNEEEYRVFLESRHERSRWQIVRLGWTADYNDAGNFLNQFRRGSVNNDPGYADSSYDELLTQAENEPNPTHRRAILEASERTLLADYPIMPLYFYVAKRLVKPYVHGYKSNPLNHLLSRSMTILQP